MAESSFEASFDQFYCLFPLPQEGKVDKLLNNQLLYILFENFKILNTHFMALIKHDKDSVLGSVHASGGWIWDAQFNRMLRDCHWPGFHPPAHDSLIGESYYSWEAAVSHISREEAGPKIEVESRLSELIGGINHIYWERTTQMEVDPRLGWEEPHNIII